MASSTHHHHLSNPYGGSTAAPPPTPSTQPNPLASPDADVLSLLLHRLPPTLSLPTRRSPPSTPTTSPPLVSLSPQNPNSLADLLSAASQLGFFQLTTHSVPSQLAHSAESESLSLFNLSKEQKQLHFPPNWPLGFDCDDEEDENGTNASFCIDLVVFYRVYRIEFILSLRVDSGNGEARAGGDRSSIVRGCTGKEPVMSGKFYPYVVGLHYQIRRQRCSLLSDSGWVSVSPRVHSILVTLGDLAQVWSNGKTKKVRGRPVPSFDDSTKNARCIWMSLLVTLPLESTVSPLIPMVVAANGEDDRAKKEDGDSSEDTMESRVFNSFSFEDYAWRVYHERLLSKDPLDRYRI
ncbi:2-oxoglutarate (2OG) and Fe(II)-dependent oxygenase superfamily protein [Actinidia rufa]|uniref:2-oxoglutarate (2OG) and Fe(II)-dependent oxygenase superfamily protein n=1 Tax=Actinidia rufa TaxID=165716 RepID=A0A7J0E6I5_9ERIC|nr:2-oxoglutarate (2OG) and Fe(II)-dependent oxygenase superfamily protein [Actinidia rufa]